VRAGAIGALLALACATGCGRGDGGTGENSDTFGDTGGLIAVDPADGGSGGTGTTSAGTSGTGGASTTGTGSGSGGSGTTTSGSGSGGSSGGGAGTSSSGGTSSGGGTGTDGGDRGCPLDVSCQGALPYCDLNRSPPACVAGASDTVGEFCFGDSDCNFGEVGTGVVCDLFFTCAPGCWRNADCTWDLPFCDTNSLFPACVAGPSDTLGDLCFRDADCNFGLSESQIVCGFFVCTPGCHGDSDCLPTECCDGFWEPGVCGSC